MRTDGRLNMSGRQALAMAAAAVMITSFGVGLPSARGQVVVSYANAPGQEVSQLGNLTGTMNFDSLSLGVQSNLVWSGVGTYNSASIIAADQYGGAGGAGKYLVQSTSSNLGAVSTTTLTLNTPSAYFGLWWSAGDAPNVVQFYNGTTLVAQFTTATILSVLPATYDGNPDAPFKGNNSAQPYAFLNFFAVNGQTWNKIVFTNNNTSGLETDNHTDRTAAWSLAADGAMPGVVFESINGTTESSLTLASANAITSPVNLGNVRTKGAFTSKALTLTNTAAAGASGLDAAIAAASGTATASGSVSRLAAGSSNTTSLMVGLTSPPTAGAQTGTVIVSPSSNNGAGIVIAVPTQTVTVTGAAYDYANPTSLPGAAVAFGNVRPGTTLPKTVAVGNSTITNASYQDSLNATVTPSNSKLAGSGFTALAASSGGATTGNLTLTANISTAGSLVDNNVAVGFVSNANGVTGLSNLTLTGGTLTTTGGVYDYANPSYSSATLAYGNVHVGATKTVAFTNPVITDANYQDNLAVNVASGLPSTVSATSISSIGAGTAAQNLTFTATAAGALAATANLNLVSNPLASATGLAGRTTTGSIPITGYAYDYANPTPLAAVNFGNVRPSATADPQTVAVGNATITNATYQESLNASIAAASNGKLTTSGSFTTRSTSLAPSTGGTTTKNLTVTANISTAGSLADSIAVTYTSRYISGTGLSNTVLSPSSTLAVTGGVYDFAQPTYSNATLAFGNVHVGATQSVPFTNPAITNANYQDNLAVSVASGLPSAVTANSISSIVAGTAAQNLTFTASAAGPLAATANLNLVSNPLAAATGLAGRTTAGTIPLTGTAYNLASAAAISPVVIKTHVGVAASTPISVTNNAPANATYTETLSTSGFSGTTTGFTTSGSANGIAGGTSGGGTLTVGVDTSLSAGLHTGSTTLAMNSNAVNGSGLGTTAVASQAVGITADVYRYASATVTPTPINLGNVRTGTAFGTQNLTVTNTAANDGFSEQLDASFGTITGSATTNGGSISLLAPQSSSTGMHVGLSTPASPGVESGTAQVTLISDGSGTSGLGTSALAPQTVTISGTAYNYAALGSAPQPVTVNYGNFHLGAVASVGGLVNFTNTATSANVPYTDDLVVTGTGATGNLSGGPTQTLAANNSGTSGSYSYAVDTSAAGLRTGTMTVNYTSTPKSGVTGLDTKSIATQQITASADVYTGQSTWNVSGGGNWGGTPSAAATHANWDSLGGAPGVWGSSFDNVDTATFGNAVGASSATISVTSPVSVAGITFNNTQGGSYTIAANGGSLTLKSSTGSGSITDSSGNNTITAPVTLQSNATVNVQNASNTLTVSQLTTASGTQNVTKTGSGTLNLTGASNYTGTTTVNGGTLLVNGAIGAGAGLTVNSTGTLAGTGNGTSSGLVSESVTINSGGSIAPGAGPGTIGTLTTGAQTWSAGGTYAADIGALPSAGQGVYGDLLKMSGITESAGFRVSVSGTALSLQNQTYDWLIAQSSSGTFDTTKLSLSVSGFTQPFYKFALVDGSQVAGGNSGQLYVQYNYSAVPEATTLLLGMAGFVPLLLQRRVRLAAIVA